MAIQISGTTVIDNSRNVINVAAGSSTAPSIRSSDGNTGIYFPSADNLSFATNGVLRLNIDSAGDTVADGLFKERFAGQYWNVVTQADVGYGASQVPLNQYLGQLAFLDDFSPNGLRRNGGASDDVIVGTGGTVGIISDFYVNGNTYIPTVASDITMSNGNIIFPAVAGRGVYFGGETSGTDFAYIREAGNGQLHFGSDDVVNFYETDNNTERVNWSLNTGTFTFNGTVIGGTRLLAGTSSVTGTASQNLQVSGGAYVSGDVGIGTTNPGSTLDVRGSSSTIRVQDNSSTYSVLLNPTNASGPRISFGLNGGNTYMDIGSYGSNLNNIDNKSRDLKIFSTSAPNAFYLQASTGNLGVGVINPSFKIDCSSDIRIQSTNKMRFGGTTGTTNFYIQYNSTSNSLDFVAG